MTYVQILNDLHLADKAPVNCTESYTDDLFNLLYQTVEVAREYKAVTVFAGDIFHIKQPARNSHYLVQRAIDLIKAYPHQVYIVLGNHDLSSDRQDSVSNQPVGVLLKSGALPLEGWESTGLPLYGVSWLQRFTDQAVSHSLKSYRDANDFRKSLVVTHAPLYPPGRELPYEYYPADKWASAMGCSGSVAYGHVHDFHGVWESNGVSFCNNGAISRGSLTESHLTRKVYTTLWSSINGKFQALELQAKPAEEVFKVDQADRIKKSQLILDDFLSAIGHATIEITSTDSVMAYIRTLDLDDTLITVIKDLLEGATSR